VAGVLNHLSIPAVVLLAVLPMATAQAQDATLVGDTYIASDAPDSAFGAQERMLVDATRRGLVQFELPAMQRGQVLRSATLTLFAGQVPRAGTIGVAILGARWIESAVTARTLPLSGTRRLTNIGVSAAQSYVAIDVTSFVQTWIEGTPNHGFVITAEAAGTSAVFDTKESTATSHPARLELTWAGQPGPPGPRGLTGPKGEPGPPGIGSMSDWAETGRVLDARRMALRRWGKARSPVRQIPLVYEIPVPEGQQSIKVLGIETDGDSVYILLSTEMMRFRTSDGAQVWHQEVSGTPGSLPSAGATILHDGGFLWRLHPDTLVRVRPETGNQSPTLSLSGNVWRLAFDGNHLWLAGSNGVRILTAGTGSQFENPAIEATNSEIGAVSELTWDGDSMWAAVPAEGVIAQLSSTGQVLVKRQVCPPGGAIPGMVFDGTAVWVSCGEQGMLARWNTGRDRNPEGLSKVDAGGQIGMLEFDGASIWAIRKGGGNAPSFVRVAMSGSTVEPVSWPGLSEPVLLRFDGEHLWALMKVTAPGAPSGALVKF